MSWTDPITWVVDQIVSAADLIAQIKNNMLYLLTERTVASSTYVGAADLTTTSATFADADATNLKITITPKSTRVRVTFIFAALTSAGSIGEFDIYSAGKAARFGEATHGMAAVPVNRAPVITLVALFTGLTANIAQDFTLRFRSVTATNTTTIYNNGYPVTMIAEEC